MVWEWDAREEMLLLEARFRALVAEWKLGRQQVAKLLDLGPELLGLDLVPQNYSQATEHRMRLLVEIRDILPSLFGDLREVQWWVRGSFQEDEELTPLAFMSAGVENLRALRRAILARAETP